MKNWDKIKGNSKFTWNPIINTRKSWKTHIHKKHLNTHKNMNTTRKILILVTQQFFLFFFVRIEFIFVSYYGSHSFLVFAPHGELSRFVAFCGATWRLIIMWHIVVQCGVLWRIQNKIVASTGATFYRWIFFLWNSRLK